MTDRLRRARARLLSAALVRCAAWAAVGFGVAAAAVGVAIRWLPAVLAAPLLFAALGLAVLKAAVCGLRLTPDTATTARHLERHFGLQERLSTTLEVTGRRDAMAEALREDAAAHARALDLTGFARPRLGRAQLVAAACAAVLAGLAWLAPAGTAGDRLTPAVPDGPVDRPAAAAAAPRELLTRLPGAAELTAPAPAVDRDERTNARPSAPPGGARSTGTSVGQAAAAPQALQVTEAPTSGERPQAEAGATLSPPTGGGPAGVPPAAAELPTARNDGGTNPQPQQAGTRDQELREYARHREAAAGAGGGEPVAMVDAAVAGDATAGLGEADAGAPPPPAAGGEELSVPDVTDPSGRRVKVERLPDEPDPSSLGVTPGAGAFVAGDEPTVSRIREAPADQELLRRYFAPAPEGPP